MKTTPSGSLFVKNCPHRQDISIVCKQCGYVGICEECFVQSAHISHSAQPINRNVRALAKKIYAIQTRCSKSLICPHHVPQLFECFHKDIVDPKLVIDLMKLCDELEAHESSMSFDERLYMGQITLEQFIAIEKENQKNNTFGDFFQQWIMIADNLCGNNLHIFMHLLAQNKYGKYSKMPDEQLKKFKNNIAHKKQSANCISTFIALQAINNYIAKYQNRKKTPSQHKIGYQQFAKIAELILCGKDVDAYQKQLRQTVAFDLQPWELHLLTRFSKSGEEKPTYVQLTPINALYTFFQ